MSATCEHEYCAGTFIGADPCRCACHAAQDADENTHDPCCPTRAPMHGRRMCQCDVMARVRAHERERCEQEFSMRVAAGMRHILQWRAAREAL